LLKRVEPWGWYYSLEHESPFTWAEPGDSPQTQLAPKGQRPVSPHLRAARCPEKLKKPPTEWPTRLKPWQELELLRLWREEYDQNALTALCEAHRPMVVSMAQKYVGANRKIIIEYGMFGLRIAASARNYDPTKARLSSDYGRKRVKRFMSAAAQAMGGTRAVKGERVVVKADSRGSFWEPPLEDGVEEFGKWAKTPIPSEHERDDTEPETPKRWIDELIEETSPRVRTFDFDSLAAKRRGGII